MDTVIVKFVFDLHAHRAQRHVGAPVVERDERAGDPHPDQVGRNQQHRGRFRPGDGDVLRHHLAEQHVQHHDEASSRRRTTPYAARLRGCRPAWNGFSSRCATAGSPMRPSRIEHTVMPSCAPASISERFSPARITVTALCLPCSTRASRRSRRAEISANSDADEERVGAAAAARSAEPRARHSSAAVSSGGRSCDRVRRGPADRCGGHPSASTVAQPSDRVI